MGGGGHMSDMNKRIENNRSMRASQKPKKKLNRICYYYNKDSSEKADKPSKKVIREVKSKINNQNQRDRIWRVIVFGLVLVCVLVALYLLLFK